jgi:hypothetical protein
MGRQSPDCRDELAITKSLLFEKSKNLSEYLDWGLFGKHFEKTFIYN